jgi:cell division transport system permease protein
MHQLNRIMKSGSRNLLRNMWLSTAATAVMTVTLTIVILSFISNMALTSTIKSVTDKIDVSVYLKADITTQEVEEFKKVIISGGNVAGITYVTKEQAIAQFREKNKNDQATLDALTIAGTDTLPASLQIKSIDPKKLDVIADTLAKAENQKYQDPNAKPSYSGKRKNSIDRIVSFSNFFRTTGLILSFIFVVISILIIFNTIRMAIFTRRDEIEIMKLVGATKWFIRGPFIFEAALYGVIASFIAVGLSYLLLLGGGPKMASYIDVQSAISLFQTSPLAVIGVELVIGIFIGTFSSLLAMTRYLKL